MSTFYQPTVTIMLPLNDEGDTERALVCAYYADAADPSVGLDAQFDVEEVWWDDNEDEPVPETIWPARQSEIEERALEQLAWEAEP